MPYPLVHDSHSILKWKSLHCFWTSPILKDVLNLTTFEEMNSRLVWHNSNSEMYVGYAVFSLNIYIYNLKYKQNKPLVISLEFWFLKILFSKLSINKYHDIFIFLETDLVWACGIFKFLKTKKGSPLFPIHFKSNRNAPPQLSSTFGPHPPSSRPMLLWP